MGCGSRSTTATDGENEVMKTVVAVNHGSQSMTGTGKRQESEPMSIVGTALQSQTITAAASGSQCTDAITAAQELVSVLKVCS